MCICVWDTDESRYPQRLEEVIRSVEAEVTGGVNTLTWVLGSGFRSSGGVVCTLNHRAISPRLLSYSSDLPELKEN